MVEMSTRKTERSELRERFAADSAQSEKEAMASGKAFTLAATFDYLATRVSGEKVRRPRTHSWHGSKYSILHSH